MSQFSPTSKDAEKEWQIQMDLKCTIADIEMEINTSEKLDRLLQKIGKRQKKVREPPDISIK